MTEHPASSHQAGRHFGLKIHALNGKSLGNHGKIHQVEVSINGGIQNGWFKSWKIPLDDLGGRPMTQETPISGGLDGKIAVEWGHHLRSITAARLHWDGPTSAVQGVAGGLGLRYHRRFGSDEWCHNEQDVGWDANWYSHRIHVWYI